MLHFHSEKSFVSGAFCNVTLRVRDGVTGAPIEGISIEFPAYHWRSPNGTHRTDQDGLVLPPISVHCRLWYYAVVLKDGGLGTMMEKVWTFTFAF